MPQVATCAIGNIFQHTMIGVINGRPTNMVTRWQIVGLTVVEPYPTGVQDIATALNLAIGTPYRACLPTNWSLTSSRTQRIAESETHFPPVASRAVVTATGGAGTYPTGAADAPDLAVCIQRFSYKSGKTEQGELRIGPIAGGLITASALNNAIKTAAVALGTVLVSNVNFAAGGGTLAPIAWRKGTKAVPNQPFLSQYFAFIVPPNYTTMTRRKLNPFG